MEREAPEIRERYLHVLNVPARWMDNDVYYSYFELDIERSTVLGLVEEHFHPER